MSLKDNRFLLYSMCNGLIAYNVFQQNLELLDVKKYIIWKYFQELASNQGICAASTTTPGPPSYDIITQNQGNSELPPPSYAEAIALLQAGVNGK